MNSLWLVLLWCGKTGSHLAQVLQAIRYCNIGDGNERRCSKDGGLKLTAVGFKLHAAVNSQGQLAAVYFTPANEHDGQQIPHLVNDATVIAVGDGTYNASVMRRKMWREHKAYILAPPHYKQNKKLLEQWQLLLLHKRTKVECTFDYLKEHLLLETSFPRSVQGYALHYMRVLLAYQLMWGF